jgi:hypothetical protein
VNPTTAKLLYSVPLGGPVLGLTCCDTAHGRSSCVIFHSISADRSQVISESLDMRLVLRFAEKVSQLQTVYVAVAVMSMQYVL